MLLLIVWLHTNKGGVIFVIILIIFIQNISDIGNVLSDIGNVLSDIGNVLSDIGDVLSDIGNVLSDIGDVLSDIGNVLSDIGNVFYNLINILYKYCIAIIYFYSAESTQLILKLLAYVDSSEYFVILN